MQILRNAANFMFVNVFLYHFGSNFVRFERKKCHLCGTVWNMCRAERKKWGEMWETHEFFRRGIWAERLEKRFCNFVEISTWQKPEILKYMARNLKYMPYVFYEKAYVFFGVQCRPQNFL